MLQVGSELQDNRHFLTLLRHYMLLFSLLIPKLYKNNCISKTVRAPVIFRYFINLKIIDVLKLIKYLILLNLHVYSIGLLTCGKKFSCPIFRGRELEKETTCKSSFISENEFLETTALSLRMKPTSNNFLIYLLLYFAVYHLPILSKSI